MRSKTLRSVECFPSAIDGERVYITFTHSDGTPCTFDKFPNSKSLQRLACVLIRMQREQLATVVPWYYTVGWTATVNQPADQLCGPCHPCAYQVQVRDELNDRIVAWACQAEPADHVNILSTGHQQYCGWYAPKEEVDEGF